MSYSNPRYAVTINSIDKNGRVTTDEITENFRTIREVIENAKEYIADKQYWVTYYDRAKQLHVVLTILEREQ